MFKHFFYDPFPPPPPLPSFLPFFSFFALSQFRGPDYLGAWNRLFRTLIWSPEETVQNLKSSLPDYPTSSNIENWWRSDYRWRHYARHITSFVEKKNARKRWCWNCNIWPNWFTCHQSHYCLYYNGIPEFVRKRTIVNNKIAQTTQNIWNFIVR